MRNNMKAQRHGKEKYCWCIAHNSHLPTNFSLIIDGVYEASGIEYRIQNLFASLDYVGDNPVPQCL
jgi:hypothetical protein